MKHSIYCQIAREKHLNESLGKTGFSLVFIGLIGCVRRKTSLFFLLIFKLFRRDEKYLTSA